MGDIHPEKLKLSREGDRWWVGEKMVVKGMYVLSCSLGVPLGWWSDSATQVSHQGWKCSKAESRGGNVDMGR